MQRGVFATMVLGLVSSAMRLSATLALRLSGEISY